MALLGLADVLEDLGAVLGAEYVVHVSRELLFFADEEQVGALLAQNVVGVGVIGVDDIGVRVGPLIFDLGAVILDVGLIGGVCLARQQ